MAQLLATLKRTGAAIMLDVVPHNMHELNSVDKRHFCRAVAKHADMLVGESATLFGLAEIDPPRGRPSDDDLKALLEALGVRAIELRYGVGNISRRTVAVASRPRWNG